MFEQFALQSTATLSPCLFVALFQLFPRIRPAIRLPKRYLTTVNWPPSSRNLSPFSSRRPAFQSLIPHVCRLDHFQTSCFLFYTPINYLQASTTDCPIGEALTTRRPVQHLNTLRLDLARKTRPNIPDHSSLLTICASCVENK